MYLETMQQIMTSTSKVLVDDKGGGNLLYLPLDKIMQMSAAGLPRRGRRGQAVDRCRADARVRPARSRDALRSRDRESRP